MSPASYLTAPPRVAWGDYSGCYASETVLESRLRSRASASSKSSWVTDARRRRGRAVRVIAASAASCASAFRSAGEKPSVARGELLEVDADRRHPRGVEAQDREPAGLVGQAEDDRAREAAAAQQRGVELVGPVRRADHEDAALAGDAVDLGEQLVDVAVVRACELAAAAGDRVDLVDEDDRGPVLARALEQPADVALGLADPLAHHVGAGDRVEGRARLRGEHLRDRRLAGAGRAGEQEPGRRLDAEAPRRLRVLDHRLELLQLRLDRGRQDSESHVQCSTVGRSWPP